MDKARMVRWAQKNFVHLLLLFIIIGLAAMLRLIYLGIIPNGISGDELTYILTIKAMALTGHDMTGTWNPWSVFLFHYPKGQVQAELPYFLFAPVVGYLPFSLFAARITNAIVSIGTVILMYLVAKRLWNERVGLIAAFITAINPWFIYIGRTAYEAVPATFFFLCILYLLLTARRWKILLVVPCILLAFYSYIATKTILFLFVLSIASFMYFVEKNKKDKVYYVSVVLISLLLTVLYLIATLSHPGTSRLGEIVTPFTHSIAVQVNILRQTSIYSPLDFLFENKFSVYVQLMIFKLSNIFSPVYLFVTGDAFFSIWSHGVFYIIDLLFLLLGYIYLLSKRKTHFFFLLVLMGIAVIPHLLHGTSVDNFTPHIMLLFPIFILIISVGIDSSILFFSERTKRLAFTGIIIIVYLVSLLNFLHIYFFQFPLKGYFDFNMRIASSYIYRASQNGTNVNVYTPRSEDIYLKYLFYENAYNQKTVPKIKQIALTHVYNLGNIHFLSCDQKLHPQTNVVSVYDADCGNVATKDKYLTIKNLSDGGNTYFIYGDPVCHGLKLKQYPGNFSLSKFSIEQQNNRTFCSAYIY